MAEQGLLLAALQQDEELMLQSWLEELRRSGVARADLIRDTELTAQCRDLLEHIRAAAASGGSLDINGKEWATVRELLSRLSRSRAQQGLSARETATFVFALKRPLNERITARGAADAAAISEEMWKANTLLDSLGLYTVEMFMKVREEIIMRQQQELLELSTPVVKLWEGILALPMIGTLDSARTQVVMESLLQRIVETGSSIAILDITGVPTVDTLVAQHLLKTVAAARLMGAECIISGIRPQIAQTIVHLGVDLKDVATKASLADAFRLALQQTGATITSPRKESR
jgi:rsbT co-antagonist protein RsbR